MIRRPPTRRTSRPIPAPSTSTASPAAEGRVRVVRTVVGAVGELAITAGVVLLLFVVWELGFVAVTTNRAQAATVESLERQFAQPTPTASTSPTTPPPTATA